MVPDNISEMEASEKANEDQSLAAAMEVATLVRCHYKALRRKGFSWWMAAWMTKSFHDLQIEGLMDEEIELEYDDD